MSGAQTYLGFDNQDLNEQEVKREKEKNGRERIARYARRREKKDNMKWTTYS